MNFQILFDFENDLNKGMAVSLLLLVPLVTSQMAVLQNVAFPQTHSENNISKISKSWIFIISGQVVYRLRNHVDFQYICCVIFFLGESLQNFCVH